MLSSASVPVLLKVMFSMKQLHILCLIWFNLILKNLSSDDEDLKLEEDEVLRMRAEQTGSITAADAGLEDDSEEEEESDRELTMEVCYQEPILSLYSIMLLR